MRTIWLVLLLLLVGLVTMACIRFEIGIVVNDDGSGIFSYQIAVQEEVLTLGALTGEEIGMPTPEEMEDLPRGSEIMEYREDGYTGFVISLPIDDFTDAGAMEAFLGDLNESGMGDSEISGIPHITENEDGGWEFSMQIPGSSGDDDELGLDEFGGGVDELAGILAEDGWFRVRVKLPGELAEHNADRIENGALVWELDFTFTESRQLTARTVPEGGISIIPMVISVASVVVLVGLVYLAYVRRRR